MEARRKFMLLLMEVETYEDALNYYRNLKNANLSKKDFNYLLEDLIQYCADENIIESTKDHAILYTKIVHDKNKWGELESLLDYKLYLILMSAYRLEESILEQKANDAFNLKTT